MAEDPEDRAEFVKLEPVAPPEAPTREGFRVLHLMLVVGISAFVIWLGTVAGLWIILLIGVVAVASAVGLAVVLARRNATQQESLLWALAIAADRSLPLAPAALAFADQFGPGFRWRVKAFAGLLNEGMSVPEALDRLPNLLTREAQALVRTGWATGTLPQALKEAAVVRTARQTAWVPAVLRFCYLGVVFLALQLVSAFILYFITPKFEAIFKDFGLQLPPATLFTIRASHLLVSNGWLTAILVLAELAALVTLPLGFFNVFQYDLPVLDRLFVRRHSTLLLRALALTVQGGKPVVGGVETLIRHYPSQWVRGRLRLVAADLRQGADWVESLLAQRLIGRSEAAVISSAERVGNLVWALRETAEASERRIGYRLQFLLQTLFPVLVLFMGGFVLLFCVAYFSPVIHLIGRLSG